MRFALSLNGSLIVTPSLQGQGYLNAHLLMANRAKDNDYSRKVRPVAIETRETETVYMKWPETELKTGDVLEIRVLPQGEGHAPSSSKTSSAAPQNLFSNKVLAKELVETVSDF